MKYYTAITASLPLSDEVGRQELIALDSHRRLAIALVRQGKSADALCLTLSVRWRSSAASARPTSKQLAQLSRRLDRIVTHLGMFLMPTLHAIGNGAMTLLLKVPLQLPRLEDTPFGDDAGDELGRRHVKGRIVHVDPGGRDRISAVDPCHF